MSNNAFRKPVIGINTEFRPERNDDAALTWITAGYYDCIAAAGGLPVMLPPVADDDDLKQQLELIDGLVLTGCPLDLDPVRLGFDPHPLTRPMPTRREDYDRRLAKMAAEIKMPTLGIGAGMQLMNVICGGTLFQHVPEDCPRALQHRDPVETHLRHLIDVVPGTLMFDIYGPGEIRVNSAHHMAVDQIAPTFRVSATCPDGVVEAYESIEEDWYCIGTQFHPESPTASALDMQVFESFLTACVETQAEFEPEVIPISRGKKKAA